jgi:uncharacterized repeat protein (TIGR03843 family)
MNLPDVDRLRQGDLQVMGRIPWASNYTLLASISFPGEPDELKVVYKPQQGESPLWDFPDGTLCRREVAAYRVCRAAGWDFVPPTTLRDGPAGLGAVQAFIDHDPAITAFELAETHEADLMAVCAFDLATNNADRKAGHVFLDEGGALRAVDHGLCFHEDSKVRTVLWDFVGEHIPAGVLGRLEEAISGLDGELCRDLEGLLAPEEIDALRRRISDLLESGMFPAPGPGRPYPWPPV